MSNLAIITARGGSKRIPRKNIRDFCGKPILAYSIEAALNSKIFDEVMVSTDDEEIRETAIKYGAKVPFMRSELTSSDHAMTNVVLIEVLNEYKKRGRTFDFFCCIYPTAPFIIPERLIEGMNMIINSDADSSIPVVPFSFPPQRGLYIDSGRICFIHPEYAQTRSQDLDPIYHDVGQFYCARTSSFEKEGKLIMDKTIPIIISEMEAQDIDNESDWKLAELKYRMLHE